MTIAEAISMADSLKPNMMGDEVKIKFLCQIDQIIWDEILTQHVQAAAHPEGFFLHEITQLIDAELELTDLQEKAEVVTFIDMIRGRFHDEILRKQERIPAAALLFLTGMETALAAKVTDADEYEKDELVSFLEDVKDSIGDETAEDPERPAYDADTPTTTELLVASPHDMLYVYWLITQIDHLNMEMEKYNNDREIFQNAYDSFSDWYTRQNMPTQRTREFRL